MTKTLVIEGMMCNHCKATVEKALSGVPGVKSAVVDLGAKTATVTTGLLSRSLMLTSSKPSPMPVSTSRAFLNEP